MDVKVKFWIVEIFLSLFLGLLIFFIGSSTFIATLSFIVSLLVFFVFRKDNFKLTQLGLLLSIGFVIVFIFLEIISYSMTPKGPVLVQVVRPPLDLLYSFMISVISFNVPFIVAEKVFKQ